MKQNILTVYSTDSTGTEKKNHMIKTYSFNTDDDDIMQTTKSLIVPNHKLTSINSPSIDSANLDDDSSEGSSKRKTKKSRQTHESEKKIPNKPLPIKKTPWYKKINWSRSLLIVGLLILFYLMWTNKDTWIPRLLTSNTRIQRSVVVKDREISNDLTDSPSRISSTDTTKSSKDSQMKSNLKEDIIENSEEKNDNDLNKNERTNIRNNEDSTGSSTKSQSGQRINIRIRKNKMTFTKEHQKKKNRHSQNIHVDDDDDDDDDNDDDNDLDDINHTDENKPIKQNKSIKQNKPVKENEPIKKNKPIKENKPIKQKKPIKENKSIKQNKPISLLHRRSQKKNRHRRINQDENSKTMVPSTSGIRLSTYNDIFYQLRRNLKSRSRRRRRQFLSTLSKTTGLKKNKLHRLIHKKDFRLLSIQTFISILDTFNLTLLVVPKEI